MKTTTYLTDKQVADRFGVARSTPWRWAERGTFPKPVKLSPGCTRWRLLDVEAWEAAKEAAA
jgi:predicted DNA-binding transcriptional regulator AlpA